MRLPSVCSALEDGPTVKSLDDGNYWLAGFVQSFKSAQRPREYSCASSVRICCCRRGYGTTHRSLCQTCSRHGAKGLGSRAQTGRRNGSHVTLARSDTRSGRTVRTHLTRRTAGNDPASPGERIRSSSSRGKTRDRRFRRTKALVAGQHCRAHGTRVGPPAGHGSLLGLADLFDN